MPIDVDEVNSRIMEIWDDHAEFQAENPPEDEPIWPRWPALYDDLVQNPDVLYVGLNPSFYKRQMQRRLTEYTGSVVFEDLRWTGFEKEVADFLKWERRYAKEQYPYFTPMRDFATDHDLSWDHTDIFVTRLTSQNKLDDALGIEEYAEGEHQPAFLRRQVDLFFDFLESLTPGVVVVENALARDFLKATRLTNSRYGVRPVDGVDPETGYQTIQLEGETPIFFTGMLSGQRALDIGSRQRLNWHILQALDDVTN